MPLQMSSQDVLRELRRIRYSSRKGRRLGLSWIARQAGYQRESVYRAIRRGWVSNLMAIRLAVVLQNVSYGRSHTTLSLGEYCGGPDPRGGVRFARRPDDRRLQATRSQSAARRQVGGANASLGQHGGGRKR
jgi:hypothetical protein